MSAKVHRNLADGRWQTMSLAEQLANVGSEFERVWSWRQKGNPQYSERAFDRMLELLDMTIADDRWRGAKRRELTRLREEICREVEESTELPRDLSDYFLAFALYARRSR